MPLSSGIGHIVIDLDIHNSPGYIDGSRLSKEVIGEQVDAPDPFALEQRVRKVEYETTELRTCWDSEV
jgi:hypothetical protein